MRKSEPKRCCYFEKSLQSSKLSFFQKKIMIFLKQLFFVKEKREKCVLVLSFLGIQIPSLAIFPPKQRKLNDSKEILKSQCFY